jgi:hypothetical protein
MLGNSAAITAVIESVLITFRSIVKGASRKMSKKILSML